MLWYCVLLLALLNSLYCMMCDGSNVCMLYGDWRPMCFRMASFCVRWRHAFMLTLRSYLVLTWVSHLRLFIESFRLFIESFAGRIVNWLSTVADVWLMTGDFSCARYSLTLHSSHRWVNIGDKVKVADTPVVLCDVLCFVVIRFGKTMLKSLKSTLTDFYTSEVLVNAESQLLKDIDSINLSAKLYCHYNLFTCIIIIWSIFAQIKLINL